MLKLSNNWLTKDDHRRNRMRLCEKVLNSKAIEYAGVGNDGAARYHNFIRASELIDSNPHLCLCYFQLKHLASIDDLVTNTGAEMEKYGDQWRTIVEEKFGDFINYGILLIGMLTDPVDPLTNGESDNG
jgi:hypothetical protein